MKKIFTKIFLTVIILTLVVVVFTPQPAQAACFSLLDFHMTDCVAGAGDILLRIASFTLTFTGFLLNMSVIFTTHIKDIYDATPAIRNVWVIIRNISSIFIIFMLLYSSIQTILGIGSPNMKKLIGNIIMAGLLINFSLFFTKVAIDASNLVSLQFYRAIAPEYSSTLSNSTGDRWMSGAFYDGGISNVFMQSLKIQTIYHPENSGIKGQTDNAKITSAIIVATYGGIILMLFASISFLAASVAFVIRTVLLLVLMAFSPVFFAGMIFPTIKKEVSNKWMEYLTNQLLFMPLYLLLMYVSMTIISDSGFMSFLQSKDGITNGSFLMKQMGVVLQYVIAIFFINLPLIGAMKFGAIGTGFAQNMTKGLREKIYNQPGFLAQHSIGRAAKRLQGTLANSDYARRNPNMAVVLNKTLGSTAGSAFGGTKGGYEKRVKDYTKDRTEFAKKIGLNDVESARVTANMNLRTKDYDSETEKLKASAVELEKGYAEEVAKYGNSKDAKYMKEQLDKMREDIETREKGKAGAMEKEKNAIKTAMTNEAKEKYAKSLEDSEKKGLLAKIATLSGATSKARKEAADSIRKDMKKSENKKLADKLEKMLGEEEKEKDEKPKDDKPKA